MKGQILNITLQLTLQHVQLSLHQLKHSHLCFTDTENKDLGKTIRQIFMPELGRNDETNECILETNLA